MYLVFVKETKKPEDFPFILSIPGLECKAYVEDPQAVLLLVVLCPLCERQGAVRRLARNGRYRRWIPIGSGRVAGWIYRRYCRVCKVAFSLIPDFILRGHSYSRFLVVSWLWSCLGGQSSRSRPFLVQAGIEHPAPEVGVSWTDLLDAERTRPGYQTLSRWTRRFSARARKRVAHLVQTCIGTEVDFKRDVAECLSSLTSVPRYARALAVVVGLWRAILQTSATAPVDLYEALDSVVPHLCNRVLEPSHKLRRAFSDDLIYDSMVWSGRPPP